MLQNSLQNLGNTFQRNRQMEAENSLRQQALDEAARRTQVEQSFRDAQIQHYSNMEEKQSDMAKEQSDKLDAIEKKYGVQQAYQDLQTAQANITKGMQGLSLDKSLPPEEKTAYLQQSIDGMPDNIKTSMLQNPQIKALYDGEGDWDAVAAAVQQHQSGKMGATDLQIKDWQAAQSAADSEDDPQQKAKLQAVADMYKSNLPAALKTTAPAVAPKPSEIQQNIIQEPNGGGFRTNTLTKSFALPGTIPTAQPPIQPPAAHIAYLQANPQFADQFDQKYGQGASAQYLKPIPGGGGLPIQTPSLMPDASQ